MLLSIAFREIIHVEIAEHFMLLLDIVFNIFDSSLPVNKTNGIHIILPIVHKTIFVFPSAAIQDDKGALMAQ